MSESLPNQIATSKGRHALPWVLIVALLFFLVYGSLYPLSGWDWQRGGLSALLHANALVYLSRSDVVTNLVVYIPLGLLTMLAWRPRFSAGSRILAITFFGTMTSFTMEYLQSYLPDRVPSAIDVVLNSAGTLIGALAAHSFAAHTAMGSRVRRFRHHVFVSGPQANLGLAIMGLWALSQLMPLVPSLDRGTLIEGVYPIINVLRGLVEFNRGDALRYALNIAVLGMLFAALVKTRQRFLLLFCAFIGIVLILKIPVVNRQLSIEAITGAISAIVLLPLLLLLNKNVQLSLVGIMVMLAYIIEQLQVGGSDTALHLMNWIPFLGQMQDVVGLEDIVGGVWPFAALAYFVLMAQPNAKRTVFVIGALLVSLFAFTFEWWQTQIPGRHADITDVCTALLGWCLPWLFRTRRAQAFFSN